MNGEELCFLSASELSPLIAEGQVSPVEVTTALLQRIEAIDAKVNAYLYVDHEGALAASRRAEAEIRSGRYRGPLHGIPVGYKDIFHVAGLPTTANSRVMAGFVAKEDATVVARLREAGTITLGKLHTLEFASGAMAEGRFARNPWDTERIPGGSSSGPAAALAAHLAPLALGSDTGGSVRFPAAFCGVTGLKPTYGRVSRAGVIPLSWSLDHVGPMARSACDVALLLTTIAGPDPRDPSAASRPVPEFAGMLAPDLKGLRLGVPDGFFFSDLHPDVAAGVSQALVVLQDLGAELVSISLPHASLGPCASWALAYSESFAYHCKRFFTRRRDYGDFFVRKMVSAALLSARELVTAQRLRELITQEYLAALAGVEAIVSPTTSVPAFRPDDASAMGREFAQFTRPVSLTGLPALALPCGFSAEGLPVSLQIVGRPWDESTVLRIGHQFQLATDWHRRRAPIAPGRRTSLVMGIPGGASVPVAGVDAEWVRARVLADGLNFVLPTDYTAIAALVGPVRAGLAQALDCLPTDLEPAVRPAPQG